MYFLLSEDIKEMARTKKTDKADHSRTPLSEEQANECIDVGQRLIAARERAGLTVAGASELLKLEGTKLLNTQATLRAGKGHSVLSRPLAWIEKLDRYTAKESGEHAKTKPVKPVKPKKAEKLQEQRIDWSNASDAELWDAVMHASEWTQSSHIAVAAEIQTRMTVQQRLIKQPSILSSFVVDLHENNLSTSMVGEEGYEIPNAQHIMLSRTDDGFKIYVVKPTTEDPRFARYKDEAQRTIDQLKMQLENLEVQVSHYQDWEQAAKRFFAGAQAAPPPSFGPVQATIVVPVREVGTNGHNRHELVTSHSD